MEISSEITNKLNQQIGKIAVWSVHHQREEQGLSLCSAQGLDITKDEIRELALRFREFWQIDVEREKRTKCFLCRKPLPAHEEFLCSCFKEAQVGKWLYPVTPQTLNELKAKLPKTWQTFTIETIQCVVPSCRENAEVPAYVAAAKFAKGRAWKSPKYCEACWKKKQKAFKRPSPVAPIPRHNPLSASLGEVSKVDLQDLQNTVSQSSPPAAES